MKSVALILVVLALLPIAFCLQPESLENEFRQFMVKYSKEYKSSEEFQRRFTIFKENVARAAELDRKDPHARFGVTQFMDLSPAEFKRNYLMPGIGSKIKEAVLAKNPTVYTAQGGQAFPASYDWRSKGMITPVYNQGQCGGCWAFSATENIESMWAIAGHTLTQLSMQQIIDCDKSDSGCNGGWPYKADQYVINTGGLEAYASYPFTGVNGQCRFDASKVVAKISSWKYITQSDNETAMMQFTYTQGPPSICVDAATWQYYRSGVITTASGCGTSLDHAVQLVGWTTVSGIDAWIVRNSWGITWGAYQGYVYVERGHDVCGIGQVVTSALV